MKNLKIFTLISVLTLISMTVQAESEYFEDETTIETCEFKGHVAASIMRQRQEDNDILKALDQVNETTREVLEGENDKEIIEHFKAMNLDDRIMIREAYKERQYFSDDLREKAISNFITKQYISCVEAELSNHQK